MPVTPRTPVSSRAARLALALGAFTAIVLATGCYERTVSARGLGADRYTVEPGYRSDTALDRWYDGIGTSRPARGPQTPTGYSKYKAGQIQR